MAETSEAVSETDKRADKFDFCMICGRLDPTTCQGRKKCRIDSSTGRQKRLSELLLQYLDVQIHQGILCSNCEAKLLTIDKKTEALKSLCFTTRQSEDFKVWQQMSLDSTADNHSASPADTHPASIQVDLP